MLSPHPVVGLVGDREGPERIDELDHDEIADEQNQQPLEAGEPALARDGKPVHR